LVIILFEEVKVIFFGERVLEWARICNFLTSHNSINIAALIKKFYGDRKYGI
jgi:hypothetical protein